MSAILTLHIVIAVAYFLAALVVPLTVFRIASNRTLGMAVVMAGATAFFVGCGLHHVDMWQHISDGTPLDATAFHHVAPAVAQVIGAPLFVFLVGRIR